MDFLRKLFGKKQPETIQSSKPSGSSEQTTIPRNLAKCAKCMKEFEWKQSYHSRNTAGSHTYNPPGSGDFRPRAFCPHCGFLVAEWDIDRQQDRNRWKWYGENAKVNVHADLPPSPLSFWGMEEIPDDLVIFGKDYIDIERVKRLFGK